MAQTIKQEEDSLDNKLELKTLKEEFAAELLK